jgi:hypothetical protein
MELDDHFDNLSEHYKNSIIMVIISLIRSDNYNACENNMRDKLNYLLIEKARCIH